MPAALTVTDLYKEYPTPAEPLVVLGGVSLEIEAAESLAIMGPSGSGKSTLLYILGGLEPPTRGSVSVNGINPFELDADHLAAFRNRRVGFVFQDHHLLPQCSALENVLIPTMAAKRSASEAGAAVERVGLSDRLTHRPAELSGGERQRVAIARALINAPPVILADEPTGNLDRRSAGAVADLLLELRQEEEVTLVLVTHSVELASRFPKRAELLDGRLQFD